MFRKITYWDAARYTLILIWVTCVINDFDDIVTPAFWIMVIGVGITFWIQRSKGQLKSKREIQESKDAERMEYANIIYSEAEARAETLRQLLHRKKEAGAELERNMDAISPESNAEREDKC